jgi:hypothetical protein
VRYSSCARPRRFFHRVGPRGFQSRDHSLLVFLCGDPKHAVTPKDEQSISSQLCPCLPEESWGRLQPSSSGVVVMVKTYLLHGLDGSVSVNKGLYLSRRPHLHCTTSSNRSVAKGKEGWNERRWGKAPLQASGHRPFFITKGILHRKSCSSPTH